jgi:polyisoprenoid-binding protein YceI|tara:strand:+ start:4828 stop:5391 length:564 start_codon:yes stop_codon:yes gene_type:complete
MSIIKHLLYFICFGTFLLSAQKKTLNIQQSTMKWTGKQITSKTHYGSLKFKSGDVLFKDGLISKGKFIVDMTSLLVEDLQGENKGKLEGHLKSDDFFSIDKFEESSLIISNSSKIPNGVNASGTLTIKGLSHPIDFKILKKGDSWLGSLIFDRSKYNVQFRSGNFFENLGDKLILDFIKIETTLSFN